MNWNYTSIDTKFKVQKHGRASISFLKCFHRVNGILQSPDLGTLDTIVARMMLLATPTHGKYVVPTGATTCLYHIQEPIF